MTIFKFENVRRILAIRAVKFCYNHAIGVDPYEREYMMALSVEELTELSGLRGLSRLNIRI